MISKELLSEVLKDCFNYDNLEGINKIECVENELDIFYLYEYLDNYGTDGMCDTSGKIGKCTINIYELAHKCKEWAIKIDYKIESHNHFINKRIIGVASFNTKDNTTKFFQEDTEHEAIFKACEWIMEQTK